MSTETATVLPQPFYQGEIFDGKELDYTVVENAELLDSVVVAVQSAARAALQCFAAVAAFSVFTIASADFLPAASTVPVKLFSEGGTPNREGTIRALSDRLQARAALVTSAFIRVPLSAAERDDDPDYGF